MRVITASLQLPTARWGPAPDTPQRFYGCTIYRRRALNGGFSYCVQNYGVPLICNFANQGATIRMV